MEDSNFSRDLTLVLGSIDLKSRHIEFPISVTKEFREKSIDDMFLKLRASNVLKRRKVNTFGQVIDNFEELAHFKNCGATTAKEIKNAFLQTWYDTLESGEKIKFWEEFIEINSIK